MEGVFQNETRLDGSKFIKVLTLEDSNKMFVYIESGIVTISPRLGGEIISMSHEVTLSVTLKISNNIWNILLCFVVV